jgi:pyruvate dehydrogenase E2 component (dihydrolipoamide acetyltransferase)
MMPQLGETVTEGTITRWMKEVGDAVERDEPLFEVSTDKVDSEVPSPAAGVLSEILVPEGETVEVGVKLAVIGDGAATAPAQDAPPEAAPEPAPAAAATPPPPPPAAPTPAPAPAPAPVPAEQPVVSNGDGPGLLSPMVRKLLAENGISESEVTGTGSGGRITRDDAQRAVEARRTATPPPAPAAPSPSAAPPVQAAPASPMARTPQAPPVSMASFRAAGDQIVPFSNMRRRTAEHMVRSKATSPHAFIANEVDFESVERVRKAWGERFKAEEGFALTYLPFVARAAVEA